MNWLAIFAGIVLASPAKEPVMRHSDPVPPARDGNVAIQQEYEAAIRTGTIEALDLFVARHPDHPLADRARSERARLERR